MEKLVSIMVLTYNHEKFIEDCLQSIYDQTYRNIELIITDNASCDHTVTIIEKMMPALKHRFTRVVFRVNESNLGIVKGVNQAVAEAKGDYVKDFSGDDVLLPDAMQQLVDYMEKNPQYDLVVGNGYSVNGEYKYNHSVEEYDGEQIYKEKLIIGEHYFRDLLERDNISAPAVLLRGNVFQNYGLFNEKFPFEDWEFWLRIVVNGGCIGVLDCPVVIYRRSSQSVTVMEKGKESSNKKLWTYYENNMMILDSYGIFLDANERNLLYSRIFEKHFVKCLNLECTQIAKKIYEDAQRRKIYISLKNQLRYALSKVGLFTIQKKIRRKFDD